MPPQLEKNHVVPTAWPDEALARDGVSREVPCSALKGETGGAGGPEPLSHFEVEVCQLPRPGLRGVLFRRVAGTALAFRTLVTRISNDLEL